MLSRYERRKLREIELWFESTDPGLVEYVRTAPVKPSQDRRLRLLSITAIIGAFLLVVGAVLSLPVLVLVGGFLGVGGLSCHYWLKGEGRRPTHQRGEPC